MPVGSPAVPPAGSETPSLQTRSTARSTAPIKLEDFFEPGIIMVCDPWIDKNASNDGNNIRAPVIGLVDTNNLIKGLTYFIPCNNKSNKSLGMVMYIIAKHYCKARGIKFDAQVKDFTGEEL